MAGCPHHCWFHHKASTRLSLLVMGNSSNGVYFTWLQAPWCQGPLCQTGTFSHGTLRASHIHYGRKGPLPSGLVLVSLCGRRGKILRRTGSVKVPWLQAVGLSRDKVKESSGINCTWSSVWFEDRCIVVFARYCSIHVWYVNVICPHSH
jgi:hypothetical protein